MLSVVVPLYNEEESLNAFYDELLKEIIKLSKEYEIIFVDDGSTDNSLDILKKLVLKDKKIKIFSFRRNQGKAEALSLGFQKAAGDYIVTLDADLQDKPTEIHKLLDKMKEGYDVVSGWRKNRKHPWFMKLSSKLFNFLVGLLLGVKLHDYNCGLKAYTKEAAKSLHLYGGLHRFIPLIAHQSGFRICEVVVDHEKRKYGKSKYGFSKTWRQSPDMLTMFFLSKYSNRPLHFFVLVGGLLTLIGILIIAYLTYIHYFFNQSVGRRPLLFMGMLFVISGFQVFFTGFLADLMINISRNSNNVNDNDSLLKYSS